MSPDLFLLLRESHFHLSRAALIIGVVGFVIAIYIGLIRHGDVTRWFRRAVYATTALMVVEAGIGLVMYLGVNARPYQDVHLIYGMGAVLSLPFFIFVETTAKKRPAMGSYIWGFALIAAITVRSIMTGAAG